MKATDQTDALQPRSTGVVATLSNVTVTFDSFASRAVSAVNLRLMRGEVFGLVGPMECGKSTILRLLAGQLRPTDGKVKVFGRSLWQWGIKSRIGYLPQRKNHVRARGLLGWFGKLSGTITGRRSSSEPLATALRNTILSRLLAKKPSLLLLDEPFLGLDPESCQQLKSILTALVQEGRTVVVSTRLLSDVCGLCNRMAVLYRGQIQATGSLDELLSSLDAIRFTGPVLPQATAERVLKIIQEDLEASKPTPAERRSDIQPNERERGAFRKGDSAIAVADRFLAPIVGGRICTKPSSESPVVAAADSIDHKKLAALVKPIGGLNSTNG